MTTWNFCLTFSKLELAVLDACKELHYTTKFQDTVKAILKFYSHSSKRVSEFYEASALLQSAVMKFGGWNLIRWIASKSRIMKALDTNRTATVMHLEHSRHVAIAKKQV